MGASLNAYTSREQTCYFAKVIASPSLLPCLLLEDEPALPSMLHCLLIIT